MRALSDSVPTFPQGLDATVVRHAEVGGFHFNEYVQTDNLTWHRHDDFNLALILEGAGKSVTPREEVTYAAGEVIFESFDVPQKHECGRLRCLNIHFPTSLVAENGEVPRGLTAVQRFDSTAGTRLMRRIHAEMAASDSASRLAIHGLTLELIADLVRWRTHGFKRAPRWGRQVEDYLRAHFSGPVSLDELAAAVGLHPAHLSRAFRKTMGCTVGEFVRQLRVDRAVELIRGTKTALSAIAVDAGFYDQADMTRALRKCTGLTPAAHRRDAN